jgi:hypothetical protein
MEGFKKFKKNDDDFVDFENSIINTFEVYFTFRSIPQNCASVFTRQHTITHDLCVKKREKMVLKTVYETLVSQMSRYAPYIGKSPRYIPFFRPLYWKHYLIVRKLGFPIDVVWMILERVSITSPITKNSLLSATRMCIKQSHYVNIHYLPIMRYENPRNKHLYLWGEELAQKIYKETIF